MSITPEEALEACEEIVLATLPSTVGVSDLVGLNIPVGALADMAGPGRTTMIMVTYDIDMQAYALAGPFTQTASIQLVTEWGVPQTAIMLVAQNQISDNLVLRFSGQLDTPVHWRAIGLVADGAVATNESLSLGFRNGPVGMPQASDPDDDNIVDMQFAFFATGSALPQMSDPDRVKMRAGVLDAVSTDEESAAYEYKIAAYNWIQAGAVAMGQDEWFYTFLQVRWNHTAFRPPPTDSDDFWAPPAPCDAADVILINSNNLAPYWDVPDMQQRVVDAPDTLLLNYVEPDGTRWMMTDLDGWWTLPPPALPDLPRPGYIDGSFPVDGRYEPRIINLSGTFWPGPGESVAVPRLRLLRALDAVRNGALLVVKEPEWPKQAWVWLSDQPKVVTSKLNGYTEFQVTLKAVDPVKYHAGTTGLRKGLLPWAGAIDGRTYDPADPDVGQRFVPNTYRKYADQREEEQAPLSIINSGTANVWPRILLYGPQLNPVVVVRHLNTQTGEPTEQRMVIQGAIQKGECLILDCYWRTVVLRLSSEVNIDEGYQADILGTNKRWMLKLSSPWIYIAPGENHMYYKAGEVELPPDPSDPVAVPKEGEPEVPIAIPTDYTQAWVAFRSGWTGS